jgi:hypothetical protein
MVWPIVSWVVQTRARSIWVVCLEIGAKTERLDCATGFQRFPKKTGERTRLAKRVFTTRLGGSVTTHNKMTIKTSAHKRRFAPGHLFASTLSHTAHAHVFTKVGDAGMTITKTVQDARL